MNRLIGSTLILFSLAMTGCSSAKYEPQIVLLNAAECKAVAATPEEAFEACGKARKNLNEALE